MKFKNAFDSEGRKRRKLAARALSEIRQLANANYPLALLFEKMPTSIVERQIGESWPEAFGRALGGLTLQQLRDYASGLIETGLYRTSDSDSKTPTASDLLNYFRGTAALLIETERELAASRNG